MCFTVQLSKIIFRIAVCLKQLCYYIMLFSACQEVFSTFFEVVFVSLAQQLRYVITSNRLLSRTFFISFSQLFFVRRNSYILSRVFLDVKNFFHLFFIQRRRRDLNPRTAQTVYTLSRGTSSAT